MHEARSVLAVGRRRGSCEQRHDRGGGRNSQRHWQASKNRKIAGRKLRIFRGIQTKARARRDRNPEIRSEKPGGARPGERVSDPAVLLPPRSLTSGPAWMPRVKPDTTEEPQTQRSVPDASCPAGPNFWIFPAIFQAPIRIPDDALRAHDVTSWTPCNLVASVCGTKLSASSAIQPWDLAHEAGPDVLNRVRRRQPADARISAQPVRSCCGPGAPQAQVRYEAQGPDFMRQSRAPPRAADPRTSARTSRGQVSAGGRATRSPWPKEGFAGGRA
jgi:hypothetical protein